MINYDSIIIGGGLSGLFAAAASVKCGQKILLLTLGAGSITIGSGTIDVLGYVNSKTPVKSPLADMALLNENHPYHKIGLENVKKAVKFFQALMVEEGYVYCGESSKNHWLITAVGTLKPTAFYPKTMETQCLQRAKKVVFVGITGLKDYYPSLLQKNLKNYLVQNVPEEVHFISLEETRTRDLNTLDVARWLDTKEGLESFIQQLSPTITAGTVLIVPPILGTLPNYHIYDEIKQRLSCEIIETVGMPPAMTGYRLRNLLLAYLHKNNVRIIEKANVTGAKVDNKKCCGIITSGIDRERIYYANHYILATGGFYGGGIQSVPQKAIEPIFSIPVTMPEEMEDWSNATFFSEKPQPYACAGIKVNQDLQPIDANNQIMIENVSVIGRNLAGYDYCYEKSGNGVAISSAYKAVLLHQGGEIN